MTDTVRSAYQYASVFHTGQVRKSGEQYITHPIEVAMMLARMHMDYQSVVAALLHDVIEDTAAVKEDISKHFGNKIADLVDGVSKLDQLESYSQATKQSHYFHKMVLAMSKDLRVVIIKLTDRLHNMQTIESLTAEKKRRIAIETRDIYAQMALRLGMHNMHDQLNELCFHTLYPWRAKMLHAATAQRIGNHYKLMEHIRGQLIAGLEQAGHKGNVIGREKHLYSIYQKMRHRKIPFYEIMDVLGFRIIVDDIDICYRVLGLIHNLYKPFPGKFKDYIAIPKANGYQGLHTTLFGAPGVPIEIQIRTKKMDDMANFGIASHWVYKADTHGEVPSSPPTQVYKWIQELIEIQNNTGSNSQEFIEHFKADLFPDEIYVFTPQGKIIELPAGATPIDFAYSIHTDIGNHCLRCRIDNNDALLNHKLVNGETVEIIIDEHTFPHPSWLDWAITSKARSAIRSSLKKRTKEELLRLGRLLLNNALHPLGTSLQYIAQDNLQTYLTINKCQTLDQLCMEIGTGNRLAILTARQLLKPHNELTHQLQEQQPKTGLKGLLPISWFAPTKDVKQSAMMICGAEGMAVSFAKCCHPLPGDSIVGNMSADKGLVVHISECRNIKMQQKNETREEVLSLTWGTEIDREFFAELRVYLNPKHTNIAELATKITQCHSSIEQLQVAKESMSLNIVLLGILAQSRIHLGRIMRSIRAIHGINKVVRMRQ